MTLSEWSLRAVPSANSDNVTIQPTIRVTYAIVSGLAKLATTEAVLEPRELAAAARAASAHVYLARWRPAVMTTFLAATVALTAVFPDEARTGVVITVALLTGASWLAAAAVSFGLEARSVAFVLTLADVPLVVAWALSRQSSTGEGMSALAAVVLIAAWLLGPRVAAAIGAVAATTVLATWFLHERWASQQALPDVVWIICASSVLAVAISLDRDRALTDVGRTARRSVTAMREVVQLRRRLVADVSHELRTPLTAINGFLDTVLSEDLDLDSERTRELLLEARRGGERLEQLVAQLLVVDRAETGELQLEIAPIAARRVIGPAARSVPAPPRRSAHVTYVDDDAEDALLLVDQARCREIIANLVSNAFVHGRGNVEISVTRLGPVLCIDVQDEGSGLVPGTEQHAFEPFTTFGAHHGAAGLGLATARAYTLAQGGSLDYVDDVGWGAHAFRLLLPLAKDD